MPETLGNFEVHRLPSGAVVYYRDSDHSYWGEVQENKKGGYSGVKASRLKGVTTVVGCFDKPALPGWAARVTCEGAVALHRDGWDCFEDPDELRDALKRGRLDHDSVKRAAADRGNAAHDSLLGLIASGAVPSLANFPADQRPYIQAGMAWFREHRPEVIAAEVVLADLELGVAGRSDLLARMPDGRVGRFDYKTVTEWHTDKKGRRYDPYPENISQLAGYELLAVSSGYEPSDFQAVVRLGPDGTFDVTEGWATPEHFLGDLAAFRNREALRNREPAPTAQLAVA